MFVYYAQRRVPTQDWLLDLRRRRSIPHRVPPTHHQNIPYGSCRRFGLKPQGLLYPLHRSQPTLSLRKYLQIQIRKENSAKQVIEKRVGENLIEKKLR